MNDICGFSEVELVLWDEAQGSLSEEVVSGSDEDTAILFIVVFSIALSFGSAYVFLFGFVSWISLFLFVVLLEFDIRDTAIAGFFEFIIDHC